MKINDCIAPGILRQSGYVAPEVDVPVKMDANENPFGLQEPLKRRLLEKMSAVAFNRYPAAGSPELRERFARYFGVKKDMIMPGNGSDELIQALCLAFRGKIKGVMVCSPTFAMYKIIGVNAGNKAVEVPLDKKFDLDVEAMTAKMSKTFPALIFLSFPNSPTGNLFSKNRIEALIRKTPGVVVIDEAYAAFSGQSLLPLLKKYDNVIFLKTLSKLGLASMRIGFLIAHREIVAQLDKVRLPYNINSLSQAAATFFLDYQEEFTRQVGEIVRRREELYQALKKIAGIRPYPSRANFIFFSCDFDSDSIYKNLLAEGIAIKNLHVLPGTPGAMRVTVGTKEQNEAFLEALKKVIETQGA
ncbi:MAG TPA: histidinol-phosphate transaminase [Smithella sp.]|nr:histidinol-phosphate transaminase [Smithella sp.]